MSVAPVRTTTPTPPAARPGFEHLAPLFMERAALPDDAPPRERLRDELISGHLQLARNSARRFAHRGDHPEDVEQVAAVGLVLAVDSVTSALWNHLLFLCLSADTAQVVL